MLKLLPIIIISSTITLQEEKPVFYFDGDYSQVAIETLEKNKVHDSQDTSNILYDLIAEELLNENL